MTFEEAREALNFLRLMEGAEVNSSAIGEIKIITVFLGLDNWDTLFETMVFGNLPTYRERYRTWEEADVGHERIVKMVQKDLDAAKVKN